VPNETRGDSIRTILPAIPIALILSDSTVAFIPSVLAHEMLYGSGFNLGYAYLLGYAKYLTSIQNDTQKPLEP
jgi:hypothetical protein